MNWHRYIRWAMVAVSALFILFICFNAGAATLKGNKDSCEALASLAMHAGGVRDSGVPWEVFKEHLDEMIIEARANPDSFVHTEDEVKFINKSMKLIWDNPNDAPILVASAIYQSCMGK